MRCDAMSMFCGRRSTSLKPKVAGGIDSSGQGVWLAHGIYPCIHPIRLTHFQVVTLHKNKAKLCRSFITNSLKVVEMKQQFWQPFEPNERSPHACALFPGIEVYLADTLGISISISNSISPMFYLDVLCC